jgi:hypothetical protein
MQNLSLRTDNIRVRDEDRRLRAWLLDKETLARIRQSLHLDEAPDLGTSGTLPGVCSASPPANSAPNSALGDVPNFPKPNEGASAEATEQRKPDFVAVAADTARLTTHGYRPKDAEVN